MQGLFVSRLNISVGSNDVAFRMCKFEAIKPYL